MGKFRQKVLSQQNFDDSLTDFMTKTVEKYEASMEKMQFSTVLGDLWALVSRTNKYIDETSPWVLAKDEADKGKLASVMAHLATSLRHIAVLIAAVYDGMHRNRSLHNLVWMKSCLAWDTLGDFNAIPAGTKVVEKGVPIFPRLMRKLKLFISVIRWLLQHR